MRMSLDAHYNMNQDPIEENFWSSANTVERETSLKSFMI